MRNGKWKIENLLLFVIIATLFAFPAFGKSSENIRRSNEKKNSTPMQTVFLPNRSPLISFRIQFLIGAANDPAGKEGLANLTAALLAGGGSKRLTYDAITAQFYPLATGFGAQVDKEMTTFAGTTHVDNLDKYFAIVREMLLDPGFRSEDFARLKEDQINYLKTSLRQGNDEELGKERLYNLIYAGTPYEHPNAGLISALEKITIQDVKDFYAKNYTRANLVLGLSGNFTDAFKNEMVGAFEKLPAGGPASTSALMVKSVPGTKIDIIARETRATAISLGFPISVNRSSKDFAALALVASFLGQHRSSNSYLYQRLREARGLNYGDYAYIEYFPRGMFQFEPDANLARHSQIFQIWIRPVEPQNAHFALRAALYEFDKLVKNGMTEENFAATKEFLSKYVNILTQTQDAALGYALDSKYYGIPNFNEYIKANLAKLTLAETNAAIKKHLATNSMRVVMVTKDAETLKNALTANAASPIKYNSEKPKEILDEDKIIENYKITLKSTDVTITPVEKVFE